MRLFLFSSKRMLYMAPQIIGVTLVTFLLVRLLPGDPAVLIAGPYANPETLASLRDSLGLDQSLPVQYWIYIQHLIHGDLGRSFTTGAAVTADIGRRLPATLELVTISLVIMVLLGLGAGVIVALRARGIVDRMTFVYGLLAGSFPDFWLGLVLSYLLFFKLGWLPAPIGRIDVDKTPPHVSGFYTIDSLVTGHWSSLWSSIRHLVLPVMTLVFVYTGAILKMTRSTMAEMLNSDFVRYARASGLSSRQAMRYALRNALPPVVTIVGISYSFLLGGAVLVENVFSWGGLGQYAVGAVVNSDYNAVQGFVLVAALFNLIVYLFVDVCYVLIDPRIEY